MIKPTAGARGADALTAQTLDDLVLPRPEDLRSLGGRWTPQHALAQGSTS
ncbi:hypothetical protein AB0D11_18190 [Streptomyces monashensis]